MKYDLPILIHPSAKYMALIVLMSANSFIFAQSTAKTGVKKTTAARISKVAYSKLPSAVFKQLIDSTDQFVVNHSTQFKHVDLPKRFYNTFLGYIKDSSSTEVLDLKSIVYYSFTLTNGKIINGDIYWNDTKSYIVFKVEDKRYVNSFAREGVTQLKNLFKL